MGKTPMLNRAILVAAYTLALVGVAFGQVETEVAAQETPFTSDEEVLDIELADGVVIKGRLTLPPVIDRGEASGGAAVKTLIIYVHGTGPATYLTKRPLDANREFNYFDYWAEAFAERGIGFFSYNKRGVRNSDTPPWFDEVDREAFRKVVPRLEADDLAAIIQSLKRRERLADARVMLRRRERRHDRGRARGGAASGPGRCHHAGRLLPRHHLRHHRRAVHRPRFDAEDQPHVRPR